MKTGPILFLFVGLILSVHLIFILVGGKPCRLSLEEIVIASNANMGGPTTAAAMASARRWGSRYSRHFCDTRGYSLTTLIGVGIGKSLM